MKKASKILFITLIVMCWGCSRSAESEKHQKKRDNVVFIQDKIEEIDTKDLLIASVVRLYPMDKYLIIADHKTVDKLMHIFNSDDFSHITSIGNTGQGPDEITIMGHIGNDETNRRFYVSDHGKQKIFSYHLDSVLENSSYKPEVKASMNNQLFPNTYLILNDTLAIAQIIEPISNHEFNQLTAKWNMETGEIKPMKDKHPSIKNKRFAITASKEHERIVECYHNHDLITIMDLDGNLKCNVYGNNWNSRDESQLQHFGKVVFRGDKIIASYSGENRLTEGYYPTKLLVFSINGDYIKTLDIGYRISDFCYDEQNDRLVFNFDDMIQFGYLQLDDNLINTN